MALKSNSIFILLTIFSLVCLGCVFSDKEYSSKIDVQSFLLTQHQVSDLFLKHEVVQKPYNEMYNESIYLAIKIKNSGNKGAWGVLHCHVDNEFKEKVEIRLVGANDTALIVLPYYGLINYTINDKPFLNTYWKNLYTK